MSDFLNDILDAINEISSEIDQGKKAQRNSMNRKTYGQNTATEPNSPRPNSYNRPTKTGYGTTPRTQGNYRVGGATRSNTNVEGSSGLMGSPGLEGSHGYEGTSVPQTGQKATFEGSSGLDGTPIIQRVASTEGRKAKKKPVSSKKDVRKEIPNEKPSFETSMDFSKLSEEDVLRGIVFSEILGRPKALRRGRW